MMFDRKLLSKSCGRNFFFFVLFDISDDWGFYYVLFLCSFRFVNFLKIRREKIMKLPLLIHSIKKKFPNNQNSFTNPINVRRTQYSLRVNIDICYVKNQGSFEYWKTFKYLHFKGHFC